jgi:hypothetical protein
MLISGLSFDSFRDGNFQRSPNTRYELSYHRPLLLEQPTRGLRTFARSLPRRHTTPPQPPHPCLFLRTLPFRLPRDPLLSPSSSWSLSITLLLYPVASVLLPFSARHQIWRDHDLQVTPRRHVWSDGDGEFGREVSFSVDRGGIREGTGKERRIASRGGETRGV